MSDMTSAEATKTLEQQYQGPALGHHDEDLVAAMHGFLEEKQVNDASAMLIMMQAEFVEQQEYERWLHDIKTFAS